MSLAEKISENNKEIYGSRTKNRLTVQISYAMQLIIEYFSLDYIILMDYIEDVAIVENPDSPSNIHMYQIKTKSADKQYTLNTVIKDEWFQKLYKNALKYSGYVAEAVLVCNTDIVNSTENVFKNEKDKLSNHLENENIKKIIHAIAVDQGISDNQVDLSHFYFVKSSLSTKGHKDEVEYKFESFLLSKEKNLQIATARALYKIIYDELDTKFNNEIDEKCSDIYEIFDEKGVRSDKIEEYITNCLAIQLPSTEVLFKTFNINSLKDIKQYNNVYARIKMDMLSDKGLLIETRKIILNYIEDEINAGASDFPITMERVFYSCINGGCIPVSYSEHYYLKLMIMIMLYKHIFNDGGNN